MQENNNMTLRQQSHLIEVSMSGIADDLMLLGVIFNVVSEFISWPSGHVTQLVNDPLASKCYRGKPLKKSVGTLLNKAVLEGHEKSGCSQNS